jgi:predicted lipoprotein
MNFTTKILGLVILITVTYACNPKKVEQTDEFKKGDLLSNMSAVIQNDYQQVLEGVTSLETSYNQFVISKNQKDFDSLQSKWEAAYLAWQNVLAYDFGPGMDNYLKTNLGTFPTDTLKVTNYIKDNNYDLASISSNVAKGFHVFDFLLYRDNAISYFNDKNYSDYGTAVITQMKTLLQNTISSWKTYQTTFVSSTGTESTSSFSVFVNDYIKAYEECKWTKVGIPLGKQSLDVIQPNYIETPKAKFTWKLLIANIKAVKRQFNGDFQSGKQGIGFDDYMKAVNKADLVTTINAEFDAIISTVQGFNEDLGTMLNDAAKKKQVDDLYTKIHNLTIHLKTDMTAAFGVMITYQDNDGD